MCFSPWLEDSSNIFNYVLDSHSHESLGMFVKRSYILKTGKNQEYETEFVILK